MEQFTKGPWHADKDLKAIYNTQCNYICDYPLNNNYDKHLIAAAPDMYAMLECHLAAWDNLYPSDISDIDDINKSEFEAVHKFISQTKQLLAKARGESCGK